MAQIPRTYHLVGVSLADLNRYANAAATIAGSQTMAIITINIENTAPDIAGLDEYMLGLGYVPGGQPLGVPLDNNVQAVASNAPGSVYPTSGLIIAAVFPQAGVSGAGLLDSIMTFQFKSATTRNAEIAFDYAMSVADPGTVIVNLIIFQCVPGDNPNGAATSFAGLSFTPGNSTVVKRLDSSVLANLALTLVAGQTTYVSFSRPKTGSGTHPGDFNILDVNINPL